MPNISGTVLRWIETDNSTFYIPHGAEMLEYWGAEGKESRWRVGHPAAARSNKTINCVHFKYQQRQGWDQAAAGCWQIFYWDNYTCWPTMQLNSMQCCTRNLQKCLFNRVNIQWEPVKHFVKQSLVGIVFSEMVLTKGDIGFVLTWVGWTRMV